MRDPRLPEATVPPPDAMMEEGDGAAASASRVQSGTLVMSNYSADLLIQSCATVKLTYPIPGSFWVNLDQRHDMNLAVR